jgi:hypothetical protein
MPRPSGAATGTPGFHQERPVDDQDIRKHCVWLSDWERSAIVAGLFDGLNVWKDTDLAPYIEALIQHVWPTREADEQAEFEIYGAMPAIINSAENHKPEDIN